MLIDFAINPDHPAPSHVKDWVRYQILKRIDDFRMTMLRSIDVDFTGDALEQLKIAFLCEYGKPKFNSKGLIQSYDPIVLAFDVSKERIEEEYNNFIADLRLLKPQSFYTARLSRTVAIKASNMVVPEPFDGIQTTKIYSYDNGNETFDYNQNTLAVPTLSISGGREEEISGATLKLSRSNDGVGRGLYVRFYCNSEYGHFPTGYAAETISYDFITNDPKYYELTFPIPIPFSSSTNKVNIIPVIGRIESGVFRPLLDASIVFSLKLWGSFSNDVSLPYFRSLSPIGSQQYNNPLRFNFSYQVVGRRPHEYFIVPYVPVVTTNVWGQSYTQPDDGSRYVWTWSMLDPGTYDPSYFIGDCKFNQHNKKYTLPKIAESFFIYENVNGVRKLLHKNKSSNVTWGSSIEDKLFSYKSNILQLFNWYVRTITSRLDISVLDNYLAMYGSGDPFVATGWPQIGFYPMYHQSLNALVFRANELLTYQNQVVSFGQRIQGVGYAPTVNRETISGNLLVTQVFAPRFDNIKIVDWFEPFTGYAAGNNFLFGAAALNPAVAMNGKLTGGVGYFIKELYSGGDAIEKGRYRARSGILYANGEKNFDLEYIEFPDSVLDLLSDLVMHQESVAALIADINLGKFVNTTATFSYKGKTYTNCQVSNFVENGIVTQLKHPTEGFPMSHQYYLAELRWLSYVALWRVEAAIDALLEQRRIRNENAFQTAYHKFLRTEAQMTGDAALADYENKLKTGYFFYENGLSYWRPYTALELQLINELKLEAERNAAIAAENERIMKLNQEALDRVNAEVIMENNAVIERARQFAHSEVESEFNAKANEVVIPTIEQLIQRSIELNLPAPEVLSKWVDEHEVIFVDENKVKIVEALMAQVVSLEKKVIAVLISDYASEWKFTNRIFQFYNK